VIVLMATLHKKEMAKAIGHGLLEKRLIACYNLSPVESAYWWKGEILEESESLLIMKTTQEHFEAIKDYLKKNSDYEVPELIALEPSEVNESYRLWVEEETST